MRTARDWRAATGISPSLLRATRFDDSGGSLVGAERCRELDGCDVCRKMD
jgi:hypothetical protein